MIRRITAGVCGLLTFAVGTPAAADVPTVPTFGPHAGFAKAINARQSIAVGLVPDFAFGQDRGLTVDERVAWLDPTLDAWNTAAGFEVFVQVLDDSVADVTFQTVPDNGTPRCGADAGACAWLDEFPAGEFRFRHCYIELWPWYPTADTVAHELGHCLGFVDVPVDQEVPGGYAGIMTHDRPWGMTPDNEYDRASLVEAGYRQEAG